MQTHILRHIQTHSHPFPHLALQNTVTENVDGTVALEALSRSLPSFHNIILLGSAKRHTRKAGVLKVDSLLKTKQF